MAQLGSPDGNSSMNLSQIPILVETQLLLFLLYFLPTLKEFTSGYLVINKLLIVSVFPPLDCDFLKAWTVSKSSFMFDVYSGDFSYRM